MSGTAAEQAKEAEGTEEAEDRPDRPKAAKAEHSSHRACTKQLLWEHSGTGSAKCWSKQLHKGREGERGEVPIDKMEPTEPMLAIEPSEAMESLLPRLAMLRLEMSLHGSAPRADCPDGGAKTHALITIKKDSTAAEIPSTSAGVSWPLRGIPL